MNKCHDELDYGLDLAEINGLEEKVYKSSMVAFGATITSACVFTGSFATLITGACLKAGLCCCAAPCQVSSSWLVTKVGLIAFGSSAGKLEIFQIFQQN